MFRWSLSFLVVCSALAAGCRPHEVSPSTVSGDYALTNVTVIDATGREPEPAVTLVVRGDRIVALGTADDFRLANGTEKIDLSGKYAIPGLIDMHVHSQDAESVFPPLYVSAGVTTVREMSGAPFLLDWKHRIADGKLLGPRMIVGSPIVDGVPSLWQNTPVPHVEVANANQARDAVRQVVRQGYDFVKVYSRLSSDSFSAIADEAKALGVSFAGHCPDVVPLLEASAKGQSTFEHLYGVMWATSSDEEALRPRITGISLHPDAITGFNTWFQQTIAIDWDAAHMYSDSKAAAVFAELVRSGSAQVSTLVLHNVLDNTMELNPEDPRLKYLPVSAVGGWRWQLGEIYLAGRSEQERSRRRELFKNRLALVGAMHRAGVTILAGTDSMTPWVFPGFGLHDELTLLVRAGLTPMEAIQAATREPARVLRMENAIGTVEEGKVADMVILDKNPLDDIRNTQNIHSVVVAGRLLAGDELNRMREDIAAAASKIQGS